MAQIAKDTNNKNKIVGMPFQPQELAPEKPVDPTRYKPTDDELADEMAAQMGGDYAYFRQQWHRYTGGYWKAQKNISKELKTYMITKKSAGIKPSRNKGTSIEWFLQADMELEDESKVDNIPQYINMRNGLFNLQTLELEPHRRDVFTTSQLDFDYDPDATCSTFFNFMASTLVRPDSHEPDFALHNLVLEAIGYTLTADTSRKVSFWLVGVSGSGKSTLIGLLRDLMGNMHTTLDLNQLAVNRFLLAQVAGKRCVTCTEADVNSVLADGVYKTLVGGDDEIVADVKNKDAIKFVPTAKIWWAMNEMPRVLDRSDAVYGRVIIIPFHRTIPASQRDYNLKRKLHDERAGIFNMAIAGLQRLQRAGEWENVEQVNAIREQYRAENDTEATFLRDRCEKDENGMIQSSVLLHEYRTWCDTNGFGKKNSNQLAKEWRRLGMELIETKKANYWKGYALKSSDG